MISAKASNDYISVVLCYQTPRRAITKCELSKVMYVICKSAVGDSINLGSVEGTGADRRGKLTTFGFLDTDKLGPS